jgi:hypothetical protein
MDENFNPEKRQRYHGWGSNQTNTPEIQKQIHTECVETLAKKFRVNCDEIKTDVDAISVLITSDDLTCDKKNAVRTFLRLFGTEWTLRCGIPKSVPGSTRVDGIFSCYDDDNKKCQHIPTYLQGNEMLVIDTPVKIALHKSCKTKLTNTLLERKIHLTPHEGEGGLCFIARRAANLPNYFDVVEAILESCFVESNKLYTIHVADFGCKKKIMPGNPLCPFLELCNKLDHMREIGVSVENCQTDVAFTIPAPPRRVVQLSCKRRRNNGDPFYKSVLTGSTLQIHPIHGIPLGDDGEGIVKDKLAGTVSLKKSAVKWQDNTNNHIIIGEGEYRELDSINCLIGNLYSTNDSNDHTEGFEHISINPNCVQSIKAYSDIFHYFAQHRHDFPLHEKDIYHIGSRQIISLKRLLKEIVLSTTQAFDDLSDYPACSRIEISIRATHNDKLRSAGHYSDILVGVVLAINELCKGKEFNFDCNYSDPEPLRNHLIALESEVNSILHFRSEYKFNQIYPNNRTTMWLRAMVTLMMITAGMAPQSGLKHITNWHNDPDRFDPYKRSDCLNDKPQVDILSSEIDSKIDDIRDDFNRMLKKRGFSRDGASSLVNFTCCTTRTMSSLELYELLILEDKLLLSRHLITEIIPFLANHLSKDNEDHDKMNEYNAETRTHQPQEMIEVPWVPFDFNNNCIPTANSISRGIHRISTLASFSEFKRPLFLPILYSFIIGCHNHLCDIHTDLPPATRKKLGDCIAGNESLSNKDFQHLCHIIGINAATANQSNGYYIRQICRKFGFPCENVDYYEIKVYGKRITREKRNKLLNEVIKSDLVKQIEIPGVRKVTIFRNANNETIKIDRKNTVMEKIPITIERGQVCYFGYEAMKMISGVCDPSCNNELFRNHISTRLQNIARKLSNIFLCESGQCMEGFEDATDLASLECCHEFQLKFDPCLHKIHKVSKFIPHIMIPLLSFATEKNIAFYDTTTMKTHIYTHQERKCIVYSIDSHDYRPIKHCTIIVGNERNRFSLQQHTAIQMLPNNIQVAPQELRNTCLSNIRTVKHTNKNNTLPHISGTKKSFFGAVSNAMKAKFGEPKSHPLLDNPVDMSLLEQLSTCRTPPTLFDNSIMENCEVLRRPLRAVLNYLKTKDKNDLNHKLICPLVCLKYKTPFGIFSLIEKENNNNLCL